MSQNETLAMLFESIGFEVERASSIKRKVPRTLHQVWAMLHWRRVDVVIIAVFSGQAFWVADFASLLASRLWNRKVVLFLHGGNLGSFGQANRRRVTRVLDRADLVLAPSPFLADVFRAWGYDVPIIPNVLAVENYTYKRRGRAGPALLWMRTFHEHYDPLLAVEVLARVAQDHPEVSMTMGGVDQGLLQATKDRAAELGVAERIDFPGYLKAEAKAAAFATHDLFLNTNRVDNMPVSVLEASLCGLVPVATSVGGIPALLTDDVDAVLVEAGDADAMARVVGELLDDPGRFDRLSLGARALGERSGWPAIRSQWTSELQRLLPDRDFA